MDVKTCSLQELLAEFARRAENPAATAAEWKAAHPGGKVVGIGGLDVPEPLIHAAGMLPVVLLEKEDQEISLANAHIEMHQCGYIRSLVEQAMRGELRFCDELLFHDCCHIVRMIVDAMHTYGDNIPKAKFIYFSPLLEYRTGQDYTAREMAKLRARLEELSGNQISDGKLSESIRLFNRQKRLLLRLYDLRRKAPGLLKATQVTDIVAAGMCMAKEDHIQLLEALLEKLSAAEAPAAKGVPVVVHGSLCERCSKTILEEIERCGGLVVDDDLYVGSKYFSTLYDEELPPMDALLNAYIHRVSPCPTRYEERNPGNFLAGMVERAGARGVIMVVVKFCEAHDYYYFTAHRRLEQLGIPEMLVETEHEGSAEGQLKTRLQGFFERLNG